MAQDGDAPGFDIEINLDTEDGVYKFAAYRYSSYRQADEYFKRGRDIVHDCKLFGAKEEQNGASVMAVAVGSRSEHYKVTADLEQHSEAAAGPDWATTSCSCPYADGNNLCKHVIALLLARLGRQGAWQTASRSGPAAPPEALAAAAGGRAPPAAAPAANGGRPPGSLATQGGKRKRVLPGSLGAAAGPPAKKRPAAGQSKGRAAAPKKEPAKPEKPKGPRAPPNRRAAGRAAAAAAAAEEAPPPVTVSQRLRGAELLEEEDDELVRQVKCFGSCI
ncbi:hypothetical protein ABPG75_013129 [Micractinium tetrahymenae]